MAKAPPGPVKVVVDNRVRLPLREIPAACADAIKADHEHTNPEYGMKRAIGVTTWGVDREIKTWRRKGDELSLPRGGMARVRARLREHGVDFRVHDDRTEGVPPVRFPRYVGDPPRWYQEEAIAAILRKEQCIIRAPTGSGKTLTAFAAAARIGLNTLVILPTGGLFKQWKLRAWKELGLRGDALGEIQGPKRRLRPITIAMQQTLARGVPAEVLEFFGVVMIDEAQLASARTYVEVVDQFPARYRIAVSADERRKDRKEFLAYDLFSEVAHEVGRKQLEDEGHVLDVEIRVIPTDFRADWYGVPESGDEKEIDFNRLLDEMEADRARTELGMRFVREEVAAGEQAIVLTAHRQQVLSIAQGLMVNGIQVGTLLGKQEASDEVEFERTRAAILAGEIRVGVGTYKALGFGIDLPAVSVGLADTPIAGNPQNFNQARGRLCRPNAKAGKKQGRFYILWDRHVYPGHLKKIIANNSSVVVWQRGKWVPAAEYEKRRKALHRSMMREG